jgi:galactose mutarotase-like enzyme
MWPDGRTFKLTSNTHASHESGFNARNYWNHWKYKLAEVPETQLELQQKDIYLHM